MCSFRDILFYLFSRVIIFALHEHNDMAAHRKRFSFISELWLLLSTYPQRKTNLYPMKDLSFASASIQKEKNFNIFTKMFV